MHVERYRWEGGGMHAIGGVCTCAGGFVALVAVYSLKRVKRCRREGKGREGKGREGKGREGKGRNEVAWTGLDKIVARRTMRGVRGLPSWWELWKLGPAMVPRICVIGWGKGYVSEGMERGEIDPLSELG